jgi:DNA-binding HxlR family transcriptional regulator
VKGKQANRQILASFLLPIHVVVEVGAATLHSFAMEDSWIEPGGSSISKWRADITGPVDSGKRILEWTTTRRWERGQVVYEQHVERQALVWCISGNQSGGFAPMWDRRPRLRSYAALDFAQSQTRLSVCLRNMSLVHLQVRGKRVRSSVRGTPYPGEARIVSAVSPFKRAAETLGDNWTLLIAREFTRRSPLSFTELLKAIRGIATNILSDRLRMLVSQGILAVTPSESDGRKLVYSLSSKGSALEPVLAELEAWASKYCSPPERDR